MHCVQFSLTTILFPKCTQNYLKRILSLHKVYDAERGGTPPASKDNCICIMGDLQSLEVPAGQIISQLNGTQPDDL